MRTRSGVSARQAATESSPEAASPTTSKPSVDSTTAVMASRKGAWSSTTSTRTLTAVSLVGQQVRDEGASRTTRAAGRVVPRGLLLALGPGESLVGPDSTLVA